MIEYCPSALVVVEIFVPFTVTVALDKGLASWSVTLPVTVFCWENAAEKKKRKTVDAKKYRIYAINESMSDREFDFIDHKKTVTLFYK